MTVASTPATGEQTDFLLRQRDRRAAFGDLLSALTHVLGSFPGPWRRLCVSPARVARSNVTGKSCRLWPILEA